MKKLLLFVLAATALAACSTDTTQDLAPEIPTAPDELQVSFDEEDTRIQLQNNVAVWTEGDLVSVFYRSNANDKWQFQGKTGDTAGTLKRIEATTATQATTKIVAVYPYSKDYWFNWNTGDVEASLPAEQTYLKDSFGLDGTIMVSQSDYNQLSLKNVCGWLKVQLTGDNEAIKSIVLRGNNGEQVAGKIYINTEDASCTLAAEMGGTNDEGVGGTGGTLIFDDTTLTSVTLNCGDGVALNSETPTTFYIALPPQTFEKGVTITAMCDDGTMRSKSTENSIIVNRNHIVQMASLAVETLETTDTPDTPITPTQPTPAANEIWYTSSYGNVVEPYSGKYNSNATAMQTFGANIVSNTYENGVGVITFDGDVTTIGRYAFWDCDALKSITIPDSVTRIRTSAFEDCRALTSVTIPDSVTTIGSGAFTSCSALKAFYGKFASADNRCLIVDGVLNSFAPAGLTEYTIPDSVTTIGSSAFEYCSALTSVTIPDSVTTIGQEAFDDCDALTSVTIPDSVTSIGYHAFYSCSALKTVYCKPTTPPSLGLYVFDSNASGRRIYVPTASVDAYKAKQYWKEYASAIYPYTFTE